MVKCNYYDNYDDIGIDGQLVKGNLKLPDVENKFNIHIGFCERLIEEIKARISEEDININKIRVDIAGYEKSLNELYKLISSIDDPNSLTSYVPFISRDSNTEKKQKRDLLNYLKKLEYLVETTCKYKLINTTPIPNPHLEVAKGGCSYKKTNKKNILEKERCIYKITGDRKEYIKYKGNFIAVRDYKKLMKSR